MKTSEKVDLIFDSFIKAQAELPELEKNKEVEVKNREGKFLYNFKYTDLSGIIKAFRPIFSKHDLGFTQYMAHDEKLGLCYVTKFLHKSGQWLETGYTPVAIAEDAQMRDVGGVATYGQRLSLKAALGVSAEDDNDGPNRENEVTTPKISGLQMEPKKMTDQQRGIALNNLLSGFKKFGVSEKQIKDYFKTDNVYKISDKDISHLAYLGQEIQQKKMTAIQVFGARK